MATTNTPMRASQPFGVTSLSEAMDQLFRDAFTWPRFVASGSDAPHARVGLNSNLYETPESYLMQVVLPGVQLDTLQITAQQNVLTLQGTAGVTAPEGAQGIWVGLGVGEFRDQVTLPGEVDAETASADYRDGILILTLPKAEKAKAKTIKVGGQPAAIAGANA